MRDGLGGVSLRPFDPLALRRVVARMADENGRVNRTDLFGSTEHLPCCVLEVSKHIEWTHFKSAPRKARLPSK